MNLILAQVDCRFRERVEQKLVADYGVREAVVVFRVLHRVKVVNEYTLTIELIYRWHKYHGIIQLHLNKASFDFLFLILWYAVQLGVDKLLHSVVVAHPKVLCVLLLPRHECVFYL